MTHAHSSPTDPASPPIANGDRASRWRTIACFVLMLVAIQLVMGPKIRLSQWNVRADENAGVLEGVAWLDGRLDLPNQGADPSHTRMHDTAYYDGKVFNVFPPLVGFLTVILSPLHRLMLDGADVWLQTPMVLLFFWPVPIVGFLVFLKQTGDPAWAALLTVGWMGGTALLPELADAGCGQLAQMNHVASQVGLLIFAADLLGKQRIWPALLGLAISVWTRQMTCLYALPLLIVAAKQRRIAMCLIGLAVIAAPLLTLNQLKFGSPLDFGYRHIYVNRDSEELAERCREHGVFSPHFLPDNFYYMHLAPPRIDEVSTTRVHIVAPHQHGVSIWLTTPLLLLFLIDARKWYRDARRRLLALGTLPVMVGLLCYHGTGFIQPGWNRFALDFLPIWLAIIAPYSRGGWRGWFTIGCIAWSLLYFQTLVPNLAMTGGGP
ncbi:MAG: hypothetical protein HS101_19355 [Planctomycetia bacterium]|nr:hypothetical protein [Planctomycetia bacterium]MCC7315615.1 hypothetical protein [Planctomycetota bacterium]